MKKGSVVQFIGTILFLVITVLIFSSFFFGSSPEKPEMKPEEVIETEIQTCTIDEDCEDNSNGALCRQISDTDYPEKQFVYTCSCMKNEDCKLGGSCGDDNRCS